ncbi:sigma-E factor negative regulatory protein [Sinimarinibacterium sp. NLF-5-8]|uniref:sigma-E factor negative regulatory protein n=1 Tax=Sinimarinibacterium sp. NLF-5-8 TaxID=2698684 RepID=UPI00137BE995|nr:sigma-E factor negative regulatory protein [Sinimarinibacterium sp. NLF-5-8]QHS09835.1 sigma-E factor negative regulatory protein [Sinimarinibacterium sp. NLF-5-8]
MTEDALSALLDGECTPEELDRLLDALEHSDTLKQTWSRMCLGRDLLGGVQVRAQQPCICEGVMSRLQPREDEQRAHPTVVPLTRAPRQGMRWKPAAAWAMAAGMAAVAVMVAIPDPDHSADLMTLAAAPAADEASAPGVAVASISPEQRRAAAQEELRQYLIEHSSTLADRGMGATMSYARVAAHSVGDPMLQSASFDFTGEQP